MKYAVISDIHGNDIALSNVIRDAKKHGVDAWIFAGDYCIDAPWPKEVIETLQSMENAFIVRGNEEKLLHIPEGDDGQFEISRWCRRQLFSGHIDWLDSLPESLQIEDASSTIYLTHKSEKFIGTVEYDNFGPALIAEKNIFIPHEEMLSMIDRILDNDSAFLSDAKQIPKGIYIFGHSHIQWHKETDGRFFINPGSCGQPLDCEEFGAPYTLLTVNETGICIDERRVRYDVSDLIHKVKETSQYREARVWSEITFREWTKSRDYIDSFLAFANEYANRIGDGRRPIAKETWQDAYKAWLTCYN